MESSGNNKQADIPALIVALERQQLSALRRIKSDECRHSRAVSVLEYAEASQALKAWL